MTYEIHPQRGLINRGSWSRLKECMKRAREKKAVTVGFLGGSITQGSLSSTPETCYAYLVYLWWKKKFPETEVTYINAGVGGTTSQYGAARVREHLLEKKPDFVLAEFAVNDDNTEFFKETYEGLVRAIYGDVCRPALMLMNNVRYDDGKSAEEMHLQVAKAYELPMVSMKSTIWPEVKEGRISAPSITPDYLHPNDEGHRLVAEVITSFLDRVYQEMDREEPEASFNGKQLPSPITENAYEHCIRYRSCNSSPLLMGFEKDERVCRGITDHFCGGFTARKKQDKILFKVEGTGIAIQYRKSVRKPTPIAKAVVDGREEEAVILDGNFAEDWGDCLYIDTVARHIAPGEHTVEITITETHEEDAVPFYLVSVIGSK